MKTIISLILLCTFLSLPTRAEVFVWNAPQGDLSLSFPDHWLRQAQLNPAQDLVISHPQFVDSAHCVLEREGRTDPLINATTILDQMHNRGSLNASIIEHRDNIAFAGRSATMTHIGYTQSFFGQAVPMKAVQYTTRLNGDQISLRCASQEGRFDAHMPLFAGVAASVRSRLGSTPFPNGYYRNFLGEHVYLYQDKGRRAVSRY